MMLKERLVQLREENGIAQIELAERLHVTRQTVSRWEGGKTEPDVDTLIAIAKIFGVSLDYLCGADEVLRPERKEELPEKEKRKKSVRVIAGIAVLAVLVMIGLTALFTVGKESQQTEAMTFEQMTTESITDNEIDTFDFEW